MTEWLIGIIGIIVGTILGWFGSLKVARRQEFYRACAEFRKSFIDEILFLKKRISSSMSSPTTEILKAAYSKHEKAIERFLPYLSKSKRIKLREAYKRYREPYPTDIFPGEESFRIYNLTKEEMSKAGGENSGRELALKNLNAILKFAEFK